MSGDSFGTLFRVSTFGESHGPAVGCIVEGVPAGTLIDLDFIRSELARRRPGQSSISTPRKEADEPEILSGVADGKAMGSAIAIVIRSLTQRSKDYASIADKFRPGHADYAYWKKYGLPPVPGGGRASGRETAARVAAGAVAKQVLASCGVSVRACALRIGGVQAETIDWNEVERNPVRSPDAEAAPRMEEAIVAARAKRDSVGGIILCRADGVPAGWGEPVFDKIEALLAHAVLSIGAIRGIEFGDGFAVADRFGSENNDVLLPGGRFATNHAGGTLGGISNGDAIVFRCAMKPTASVSQPQQTVNLKDEPVEIKIFGRHDPCLVPRAVPVVESMTAIVLADLALRQAAGASFRA